MATPKQITHDGITDTYEGWGRRIGMTGAAIAHRIKRGMSVAEALSAPKATAADAGRARTVKTTAKPRPRPAKPAKAPRPAAAPSAPFEAVAEAQESPVAWLRLGGWTNAVELPRVPAGRVVVIPDAKG